jgi:glycosyltransferase involved in cell wall biosynthesis
MSKVNTIVAVLFHRLGPYHFARLRAAGRLLPIVAIESSGVDETYAWDKVVGADRFERVTLFNHADAQRLPAAKVVSRVGSALDKIHPAVVVVPGWADSAALGALRWCVRNHVPAIIMSESTAWDEARSAWREAVKHRVVRLGSAALVGGMPHRDYMVKLGMPPECVFLGYDAVDNEYFAAGAAKWQKQPGEVEGQTLHGPRKSEVGRKYGLPENYFLASARFIEKKNLSRLIEAYARYRTLAENAEKLKPETLKSQIWDLVLLGDGPLRPALCSQLQALGLHDHVQMPGFKQYLDLPAYYGLAGAFIHASTTEQWGLVVNEAMASGLPVLVSSRCGCARDLVKDGVNGFTFDPYNVEQLAQLMFQISAFPPFRLSAFGDASCQIIADWGPDHFASGLKAAAEKAIDVGPVKAGIFDQLLLKALIRR